MKHTKASRTSFTYVWCRRSVRWRTVRVPQPSIHFHKNSRQRWQCIRFKYLYIPQPKMWQYSDDIQITVSTQKKLCQNLWFFSFVFTNATILQSIGLILSKCKQNKGLKQKLVIWIARKITISSSHLLTLKFQIKHGSYEKKPEQSLA